MRERDGQHFSGSKHSRELSWVREKEEERESEREREKERENGLQQRLHGVAKERRCAGVERPPRGSSARLIFSHHREDSFLTLPLTPTKFFRARLVHSRWFSVSYSSTLFNTHYLSLALSLSFWVAFLRGSIFAYCPVPSSSHSRNPTLSFIFLARDRHRSLQPAAPSKLYSYFGSPHRGLTCGQR